MMILPSPDSSIDLRAVTVRPTRGGRKHRLWDRLIESITACGSTASSARARAMSRCTARPGSRWSAGSRARSSWPNATAGSGGRRSSSSGLHLVCNNSRFVFLTPGRVPNLASRVPGLSLRRLSADIEVVHGCPAFLAEGSRAPAAARRTGARQALPAKSLT